MAAFRALGVLPEGDNAVQSQDAEEADQKNEIHSVLRRTAMTTTVLMRRAKVPDLKNSTHDMITKRRRDGTENMHAAGPRRHALPSVMCLAGVVFTVCVV